MRLAFEHEAAARRVGDDRQSRASVGRQAVDQAAHVGARRREIAVRLQGQAAAILRRHDHPKSVVLEHRDDHLADVRLVVVGSAAVEIHDRGCAGRTVVPARAPLECASPRSSASARHGGCRRRSGRALRTARLCSAQFASGATGVPSRPITVGRAISWLRSGTPRCSQSFARARELISAIFTSCGQTCVQMPHPEQ